MISKKAKYIGIAVAMIIIIIANIVVMTYFGLIKKDEIYFKEIFATISMTFAAILFIGSCFSNNASTGNGRIFIFLSVLLFVIFLLSGIQDAIEGTAKAGNLLFFIQTAIYIISTAIHMMFWFYQCESLPKSNLQRYFSWWIYILVAVYIGFIVINIFNGILFYVDSSGNLCWPGLSIDMSIILIFYVTYLIYILPQKCSLKKKMALSSFAIFPLINLIIVMIWNVMKIETEILSISYVFLLLAAYVVFFCDYKETQEELLLQKADIAEEKRKQTELQTALMLSQIRPHFLYNSLTAIRSLCKTDPLEAYTSLGLFADYMRGNMDAIGEGRVISFEKELEHVKIYLMLEQMRFGDELKVEYDIKYRNFSIPALALQPLVENAVRHGATMNENGGTITIKSVKNDKGNVEITVTDNGPGFDPDNATKDGKMHFGLNNVRNCLAANGCGRLVIDSLPGRGTTATIFIEEDRNREYSDC